METVLCMYTDSFGGTHPDSMIVLRPCVLKTVSISAFLQKKRKIANWPAGRKITNFIRFPIGKQINFRYTNWTMRLCQKETERSIHHTMCTSLYRSPTIARLSQYQIQKVYTDGKVGDNVVYPTC